MDFTLTTPALLFPAISLLLLAYTNRFLSLASIVRQMHKERLADDGKSHTHGMQERNLRKRLHIIRWMQIAGVSSFLLCVLTMMLHFFGLIFFAKCLFAASLISISVSLVFSLWEITISMNALDIFLNQDQSD